MRITVSITHLLTYVHLLYPYGYTSYNMPSTVLHTYRKNKNKNPKTFFKKLPTH